jgi:hypothetical protein
MGELGSDAAIGAVDIVLKCDDPSRIPQAITIAQRSCVIVWKNIVFALGIQKVISGHGCIRNNQHVGSRICQCRCRFTYNIERDKDFEMT